MPTKPGLTFTHDTLLPYYDLMIREGGIRITQKLRNIAANAADHAQSTAPWNDITGNARRGLHAELVKEPGAIILRLAHTVDYGKWLETIQDGKYAVIMPTLEKIGPQLIAEAMNGFRPRG